MTDTIRVDTERPEVGEILQSLGQRIREHGAQFASGFYVRARGGELTLASDGPAERTSRLVAVPYTAMPDTRSFRVRLDGERFAAEDRLDGPPATDLHRAVFHDMIALYNAAGKPDQWARQTPWLTLWHDPDVVEHLVNAQAYKTQIPLLNKYRAGDRDGVLVDSFLKSRTFNLTQASDATRDGTAQVVMPFIDFLNHHFLARGFQHGRLDGDVGTLFTFQDRPVEGSDECFVRYNVLDMHTAFIGYGFLDGSASFTVSQPTTIELEADLRLDVRRQTGKGFPKKLPSKLRELQIYMPKVTASQNSDDVTLSRLMIPGANAPQALRRVLNTVIRQRRADWPEHRIDGAVRAAEAQLLDANHRYFDRLAELLALARQRSEADDPPGRRATLRAVDQLVVRNKRHLYAYRDRLEAR